MNKENSKEPVMFDLLLVCAEVQQENGKSKVRFGTQAAEEVLIEMCKTDEASWNLVKSVIFDTLDKIETACGYKLNDDDTEVIRPKE